MPASSYDREDLIAIDKLAVFIGDDHPIGVAVERYTDICARFTNLPANGFRHGRTAFAVDIAAIGIDTERNHLGTQFPECGGCYSISRTIGAIDNDLQAIEADVALERSLRKF